VTQSAPGIPNGFLFMSDDIDVRRKRAFWRAGHRGTKELDLLVGGFADARLPFMTGPELSRFEAFLAATEPELQAWLLVPAGAASEGPFADIVAEIRKFHGLG
jgi:antitoxin CptB